MKVIFLDFDGVITTEASEWRLDTDKMLLVKRICDETSAKIVISSSWRRFTLEDTFNMLSEYEQSGKEVPFILKDYVVGITNRMYAFKEGNVHIHYGLPRGCEISRYLTEHKDISKYVILDDDTDMLLEQAPYFINTNWGLGINEQDVEKAIEILNKD